MNNPIKNMAGLLVLMLFVACDSDAPDLLNNDELMVRLIKDLYVADVAINKSSVEIRDSLRSVYKNQICQIHNVPGDQLDSIIQSLQMDLPRYREIMDEVLSQLLEQKDQLQETDNYMPKN